MQMYDVTLGVDRAARDTGKRMRLRVRETDAVSAAMVAEQIADTVLDDPLSYTHAMGVRTVHVPAVACLAAAA